MAVKLQRPILIGGLGLSFGLWAMESLNHSWGEAGEFGVLGAIAVGAGFWLFKKREPATIKPIAAESVTAEMLEQAKTQAELAIAKIEAEAGDAKIIADFRTRLGQLSPDATRNALHLAIAGGKSTGKTKVMQWLQSNWQSQTDKTLTFAEIPALFTVRDAEEGLPLQATAAWKQAVAADVVVFLTSGDLTDSEFQAIQQLTVAAVPVLVAWNKKDQTLPEQQAGILQRAIDRLGLTLNPENVVAISVAPNPVKVRQHQSDGTTIETMEQPSPDATALMTRLQEMVAKESQQFVMAQSYRQAVGLKAEAQQILNQLRRDRAMPVIEKYQYISAAATFANPVAALDLLATGAVTTQLIVELGEIYQHPFSFDREKAIAAAMGEQLVKLGVVELSTQTISAILKSNAVTYVAGGVVQGISAAYLTRLAGLSLIEYFQAQAVSGESGINLEQLNQTLKAVFQQNQRMAFLQGFVKQTVTRFVPESKKSESLTAQVKALQENRIAESVAIPNLEPST
jgi:uncharacterized protein (DUF697 family)